VLTGLKLGASTAVAVLFFAESFATRAGLGYYIFVDSWGRLAYTEMYAGVLAMSLLGLLLYSLFEWLERRLCPYLYLH
jgi:NitT/TauT family transport system permease protein